MRALSRGGSYNYAMQLTGRPGTHLAGSAPPHISPKGGAQGARPSRPAADRERYTTWIHAVRALTILPLLAMFLCAETPNTGVEKDELHFAVSVSDVSIVA